ncbi:polymer-forming cytoskeletal protein [Parabacteroides sp. OttesenSCG-928-G06]|nr:polymer-forming cytoskeletal protein [Parabacteroides sp. OttesenSCG-928-K15]MDL2282081.1 polymer-forming cytoskeletal protein [Parabacteroides sp. OttesenSCG-928-G06]
MGNRLYDDVAPNGMHNIISAGTTIIGNIITESDFRLDGKVEGEIACNGKLVIGQRAHVKGKITASYTEVLGEIVGQIYAENLIIKSTAVIQGDIVARSLEIEHDAQFNGTCKMTKEGELPKIPETTFIPLEEKEAETVEVKAEEMTEEELLKELEEELLEDELNIE